MRNYKYKILKFLLLFLTGYCVYIAIEVTARGYSFKTMGILGGLLFSLAFDQINNKISWDMDLLLQGVIGSIAVTLSELIIGTMMLNGILGLPVMWDYSNMPLNYNGVICLPFSVIWVFVSIFGILLVDAINYYVLHEDPQPYYRIFGKVWKPFPERWCYVSK